MRQAICLILFGYLTLSVFSCKEKVDKVPDIDMPLTSVPLGLPPIPFTEENPFSLEKWELGKKLFYDNMLSVDYSVNCGSCHKPELAFSDNVAVSLGSAQTPGRRNAPSLANVAYHPYFTREGGVGTLEKQILVPIQEHDEFNFNIVLIAERMKKIPEYVEMSQQVFNRAPDPYVITRAIATFERTLISGSSAYDKFVQFRVNNSFSESAYRGMELFFSNKTNCSKCHSGFNFTDYSFQNNGLYKTYKDVGRERLTGSAKDNALFKVPSLRNVAITAPYMHDGSLATLQDVVEHYNSGGKDHLNKSVHIRPLRLTSKEKSDLIAFLESLTDYDFINNQNFYDHAQ